MRRLVAGVTSEATLSVLYVDTEHELILAHPEHGPTHWARIETVRDRLEAAAGEPCLVRHFAEVSLAQIARIAPSALVIGGNLSDWSAYDGADLEGLLATIRAAPVPILGICAGHQLIGRAHGAAWRSLGALQPGEIDPNPAFAPGQRKECGFMPVEIDPCCPVFQGLPPTSTFFQFHYWQLDDLPTGFIIRAQSPWARIQAMERQDRPVFGVQFHPERYDSTHPIGATVLQNFFTHGRSHPTGRRRNPG